MAINIKKSHKGRFTAYKKRTGKTTTEALHSSNPHVRAMANFARNAKKFKHELGGLLEDPSVGDRSVTTVSNNRWIPDTESGFYNQAIKPFNDTLSLEQFRNLPATIESMSKYLPTDNSWKIEQGKKGSTMNRGYLKYSQNNPVFRGTNITTDGKAIFNNPSLSTIQKEFPGFKYEFGGDIQDPIGDIGQGIQTGMSIMGPIISAIRGVKDAEMQDLYGDASADLRQVNVRKMGRLNKTFIGAASGRKGRYQARLFNEGIAKQQFNKDVSSRFSTTPQSPTYTPVAKQGGFTVYKGETHEGPNGGILTDEQGNPTGLSNNKPIALTEKNEVARYNPKDRSTYIYSDSLGFAKPATVLVNKYELNKERSLYKHDALLKTAVDKQFDNLTTAQEFAKETKTPGKEALGMFKNGGNLTADKAKEMLKDGTAHKKPLTARQKKYFGWVAGGKMEFGGELPVFHEGGGIPHTHGAKGYAVDESGKFILTPEGYVTDTYGGLHSSPAQMEEMFSTNNNTKSKNRGTNNKISSKSNGPFLGSNIRFQFSGPEPTGTPSISRAMNSVSGFPGNASYKHDVWNIDNTTQTSENLLPDKGWGTNPIKLESGRVKGPSNNTGTGTRTNSRPSWGGNVGYLNEHLQTLNPTVYNKSKSQVGSNGLAPAPTMSGPPDNTEEYSPNLNPLGQVASAAAGFLDYNRLKGARPHPVNLPRASAEQISLAKQRLANTRTAEGARAVNTSNARNLGLNAGQAYSNIATANTGVNRLLGQENAKLLETETNTNAQLKTQVNGLNAELSAQEALFNNQQDNAYRMALAENDPWSNAIKATASYFIDNAKYKQGYNTLQMVAPNAEMYQKPGTKGLKKIFGQPKIRLRDKTK